MSTSFIQLGALDVRLTPSTSLSRSGIGGGGFMTVRIPPISENASSEVWTIDFREMAPAKSNTTMYVNNPAASRYGGLSAGVPGEVRGLYEAHSRWGSMPWSRLVQPSVHLAAGWPVGKELGKNLQVSVTAFFSMHWLKMNGIQSIKDFIQENSIWRDIFAPDGIVLKEGETVHRTAYSQTLAAIASDGPDAFYEVSATYHLHYQLINDVHRGLLLRLL